MGDRAVPRQPERLRTAQLARASGYSVQQVRDLERLGVIPPAGRAANNYRQFTPEHLLALRIYRGLAVAVGPVVARNTLREVLALPPPEAVARISALHVGLAKERQAALDALAALRAVQAEAGGLLYEADDDALSITELADALGIRPSTLRFWEQEGLITPERVTSFGARRYPTAVIREARIATALRAAGYRVPEVRRTLDAMRRLADIDDPLTALQHRLALIAERTVALLDVGTDATRLVTTLGADPRGVGGG